MSMAQTIALIKALGGGGGGGSSDSSVVVIHENENTGALDKTWNEIQSLLLDGKICVIPYIEEGSMVSLDIIYATTRTDDDYNVYLFGTPTSDSPNYVATSASGYPVFVEN